MDPLEGFYEKGVLKTFAKFGSLRPQLKEESLVQVFSCDFCEFFKNIFLTEHL